jgi:hypothetical protein
MVERDASIGGFAADWWKSLSVEDRQRAIEQIVRLAERHKSFIPEESPRTEHKDKP